MEIDPEPSKVTKVLIGKIHAGRKVDSKFWRSEFDQYNTSIDKPSGVDEQIQKQKQRRSLFSALVLALSILFAALVFKPDLFSFLSYKSVFSKISPFFQQKELHPKPQRQPPEEMPRSVPQQPHEYSPPLVVGPKLSPPPATQGRDMQSPHLLRSHYVVELTNGRYLDIERYSTINNDIELFVKDGFSIKIPKNQIRSINRR